MLGRGGAGAGVDVSAGAGAVTGVGTATGLLLKHQPRRSSPEPTQCQRPKIISGSLDRTIKLWDLNTGDCLSTLDWMSSEGHTGVVRCLQTDAWRIVSAADDKTIKVWSLDSGQVSHNLHSILLQ